jgi:hypothetical protein
MWYANFMLTLVNSSCIIFLYEYSKVGLVCPKNNVEKLFFYNVYHEIIEEVKTFSENNCH